MSVERQTYPSLSSHNHSHYPELDHAPAFAWSGQQEAENEIHHVSGNEESVQSRQPSYDGGDSSPSEYQRSVTREDAELSDTDPDYMRVQFDIASLVDSLGRPNAQNLNFGSYEEIYDMEEIRGGRGRGRGRPRGHSRARPRGRLRGRPRGRSGPRGPRKAAEPTGDIKSRLSKASQAFISENYDDAMEIVSDVIRINAETYEAWTLLASIFKELGDVEKTLTALMCAAHLRPKDVIGWLSCARFALEETGELRKRFLTTAKLCYQSAIRADPKNDIEARCGKAVVLRELGNTSSAISEYKRVLSQKPHDTTILRLLAELYIDQDNVEAAKNLYDQAIYHYKASAGAAGQLFGWSDINIYVELYAYLGQYDDAIEALKSLSRWVLGRQEDSWWDQVVNDDREWDADDARRLQVHDYVPGRFELQLYGEGLPLELRVKLGLYRLRLGNFDEAMAHLNWLEPDNFSEESHVVDYPDLFRASADSLQDFGFHQEALTFYQALNRTGEQTDPSLYLRMGKGYLAQKLNTQAEEFFQLTIQLDENNIEARVQLAKMYEDVNEQEQAFIYVSEIMRIRRTRDSIKRKRRGARGFRNSDHFFTPSKIRRKTHYTPRRLVDPAERQKQESLRAERLQEQFAVMQLEQNGMRAGQEGPTLAWMEAAQDLIEDFRGFKTFYPWDKYVHFLGYPGAAQAQAQTGATPLDADLAAMADRLSNKLGANVEGKSNTAMEIPENYRGISFAHWLDIFLEYALCLVKVGRYLDSYEICEAAKDAIVFYHSRDDMFLIHICWCTCALLANDEQTCVSTCRFFTRDYQFTTDTYRMFAALTRLCQSPISWYCSGPTQKYILRQIKAMDYALVDEGSRNRYFTEKGSYSSHDKNGHLRINDDMDVPLLMLYGHILYAGTSYPYALNYFFRAYALDPRNPMINLSIGLGYVHYGLKRQSENRQFHLMQGLSFIFRYYESRNTSLRVEERQEAHYNIARAYHMLGLAHLAVPYYVKVLNEVQDQVATREDLVRDAAYNLQNVYAMGGNIEMAKYVTEEWLVVF